MWSWTSHGLLIPQRAWLSMCEHDFYQPPHHYNLHIQPLNSGIDYHNYHIRYLGTGEAQHIWVVVDAPSGITRSYRVYSFSKKLFIREAIDMRDLYHHTSFSQNETARRKSGRFWLYNKKKTRVEEQPS